MQPTKPLRPLAYSIPDFMAAVGVKSRTTIYREIAAGRLKTVKCGRRRLVPHDAARQWLENLPREAA